MKKRYPDLLRDGLRWALSAAPQFNPNTEVGLYECDALHERSTHMRPAFSGMVPFARVVLAEMDTEEIQTPLGVVAHHDHLLFSHTGVRHRYGELVDGLQRLELITTARENGVRFAPLSVFLGWRSDAEDPDFYVLEAGLVDGEPRQLYFSPNLDQPIIAAVGYKPTPFSSEAHYYRGTLRWERGDLDEVVIEAFKQRPSEDGGSNPYVRIRLDFQRVGRPHAAPHWFQTQAARLRVATIAEGMGIELSPRNRALAQLGKLLRWNRRP